MIKVMPYADTVEPPMEILWQIGNTMLVWENPEAKQDKGWIEHHSQCPYYGEYITSCLYCITLNRGGRAAKQLLAKLAKR